MKNTRLRNYDYSSPGYYFITICSNFRKEIFCQIIEENGQINTKLSSIGQIINFSWERINALYDYVETDAFCIMPNHIHGIIIIKEGGQGRPPLQKIIQGFKSVTARQTFKYGYNTIWQRSYYEHIIRSELEYRKILEYIETNPLKWKEDEYFKA